MCTALNFPVCADFEENFLRASVRFGGVISVSGTPLHVLLSIRGELLIHTLPLNLISVQTGSVRTGIIHDQPYAGFVAAPCGREEAYESRGFLLARRVGEPKLGADPFLRPWLEGNGLTLPEHLNTRVTFDSPLWSQVWHTISHTTS